MARGRESEIELDRVRRSEHTEFSEGKRGLLKPFERPGFSGSQKNKQPSAPFKSSKR